VEDVLKELGLENRTVKVAVEESGDVNELQRADRLGDRGVEAGAKLVIEASKQVQVQFV